VDRRRVVSQPYFSRPARQVGVAPCPARVPKVGVSRGRCWAGFGGFGGSENRLNGVKKRDFKKSTKKIEKWY